MYILFRIRDLIVQVTWILYTNCRQPSPCLMLAGQATACKY